METSDAGSTQATVAQGEQFPARFGRTAFDVTFSLTRNGVDGITAPNRSKSMLFSKAPTGWSSQSSRATFEGWERNGRYETHV